MSGKSIKNWQVFAVILGLSFLLFGNGIAGDFVLDDKFVILSNPTVGDASRLGEIFTDSYHSKQPQTGLYRPLTVFSYSLNEIIFGQEPASFHVLNILLHALAVFALFFVVSRLISKKIAYISSTLFLFMPIHVEAVTSIVGRAELLSALFVFMAVLYALKNRFILSALLFFLALLSKEAAVSFLAIWIFLALFCEKKSFKAVAKQSIPYLTVAGVYFFLRFLALGKHILSNDAAAVYNPLKTAGFPSDFFTALKVMFLYIQKSFVPTAFSSDYSFNQIPIVHNLFNSPEAMIGAAILTGVIFILTKTIIGGSDPPRSYWLVWGVVFFLAPFFVISNFVFKTGTIMAERLMYLPSAGLAILIATLFAWLVRLRKSDKYKHAVYFGLITVLFFYGFKTIDRNRDWLTEEALFKSAYASAPQSAVNITNNAYLYLVGNDLDSARAEINRALELAPDHIAALHLAARIYETGGDKESAVLFWQKTIELKPAYLRGLRELGRVYYETEQYKKAEPVLERAVNIYSRWDEVFLLSLTKTKLAKHDEAINIVADNFGENPEIANLKFVLGLAYYRMGDREKANFYFDQVRNPELMEEEFLRALSEI